MPQRFGHSGVKLINTHCAVSKSHLWLTALLLQILLFSFLHAPQPEHGSPGSVLRHTSNPVFHPHHHRTETRHILVFVPLGISLPSSLPPLAHRHTDMLLSPTVFACSSCFTPGALPDQTLSDLMLPVNPRCAECLLFSATASTQDKLPMNKCGSHDGSFLYRFLTWHLLPSSTVTNATECEAERTQEYL